MCNYPGDEVSKFSIFTYIDKDGVGTAMLFVNISNSAFNICLISH